MKRSINIKDMHDQLLDSQQILHPSTNPDWQIVTQAHFKKYASMPSDWMETLDKLQTRLDWRFQNVLLLQCALTHFSRFPAHAIDRFPSNRVSNRSLEWLGDSVLGSCVALYLFQAYPLVQEGQLTLLRSVVVRNSNLAHVASQWDLASAMLLGSSIENLYPEDSSNRASMMETIHANAVEGLIGAVALDQGIARAIEFTNTRVLPGAVAMALQSDSDDVNPMGELETRARLSNRQLRFEKYVAVLLLQRQFASRETGNQEHRITLFVDGKRFTSTTGRNFKTAQRTLAVQALQMWDDLDKQSP
ncbi:hypothetical protein LEN26_013423 [Aphanomyces euteiches]|nr:hypothetical protein LEN26_013423 [Aphanomyces euteiches]KAH9116954.1 hypothetical protein AeMF1_009161 [Aphanomyces euteiches]KAH9195837.1 hypothetical protein AeNC1_002185 [Aphanomyces euteiches]